MNRQELARELYKACYLRGNFTLRSGQTSTEYFDKYRFESQPRLLKEIAKVLAPLVPKDTEFLAGLELGGVPIATALSLETGLPVVFVRKQAKEYGTCQYAEGAEIKGRKLLVIEDVITSGGQAVISTKDLRNSGAIVNDLICVLYRGKETPSAIFEPENLRMQHLYTMSELKGELS